MDITFLSLCSYDPLHSYDAPLTSHPFLGELPVKVEFEIIEDENDDDDDDDESVRHGLVVVI